MAGDHGHLRAMRLLPFAAAAQTADFLLTIYPRVDAVATSEDAGRTRLP